MYGLHGIKHGKQVGNQNMPPSKDSHYLILKACDLGLKVKDLERHSRSNRKTIDAVVCPLGLTETGRIDGISL
jgi:hypothetical protein